MMLVCDRGITIKRSDSPSTWGDKEKGGVCWNILAWSTWPVQYRNQTALIVLKGAEEAWTLYCTIGRLFMILTTDIKT